MTMFDTYLMKHISVKRYPAIWDERPSPQCP